MTQVFTDEQLTRYSRHILLEGVGTEGQRKIAKSRVLIIGTGGLGSPVAFYLAAAGVGTLGLADADAVDLTNLQRQIIHTTSDIGKSKVISAKEKIELLNPDVRVITYKEMIAAGNVHSIIAGFDFIVDATDNFASKFIINDACVISAKPFSHGGVLRFDGQTMTHLPGTPCYRCLFLEPPPSDTATACSRAGILGAIPGILGSIQAAEVLKFITGAGENLTGQLLTFNSLTMEFRKIKFGKNPACPVCR